MDAPTTTTKPLTLGEYHALCAAGVSDSISAWRLWRLMTGLDPLEGRPPDTLERHLRQALRDELKNNRGVAIKSYDGDLVFEGPFHVSKPSIIVQGNATMQAGAVMIMEMPSRRIYDFVWRNGYDTVVPAMTRAKAQMRLAVTGRERAYIWLIGDNGEIDEVHVVDRNDDEIATLREACRDAVLRAELGQEPSPDDEDLGAYVAIHPGRNSALTVQPGDALSATFDDYVAIKAQESEASATARGLKKRADECALVLKRALVETPTLIMPTGQTLTMERVVTERKASTSSYDKLVITKKAKEK